MTNRHREDGEGAWHHVMNRRIARRTVFERGRDGAEFLGALRVLREEGLLEVHSYCLMATHFHLLVRSPSGELGRAMMLLQNRYSRWFNRLRKRDGPLWRGRFLSKRVDSQEYWQLLVRYIDHNPVQARIVARPESYALGSASYYVDSNAHGLGDPPWLCRKAVEAHVCLHAGRDRYRPADYQRQFGSPLSASAHQMIHTHAFSRASVDRCLDDLVLGAPDAVRKWMRRKALVADGTPLQSIGLFDPSLLKSAVESAQRAEPEWCVKPDRRSVLGWSILLRSLLYTTAGSTLEQAALLAECSIHTIRRSLILHRSLMAQDESYTYRASCLIDELLALEYRAARFRGSGERAT